MGLGKLRIKRGGRRPWGGRGLRQRPPDLEESREVRGGAGAGPGTGGNRRTVRQGPGGDSGNGAHSGEGGVGCAAPVTREGARR